MQNRSQRDRRLRVPKILLPSCYSSSILNGLFKLDFRFLTKLQVSLDWYLFSFLFSFFLSTYYSCYYHYLKLVYLKLVYIKKLPMQSLSQWDSEKVFVQKFLFEATFLSFFYIVLQFFTQKLSSSNLLKKTFSGSMV